MVYDEKIKNIIKGINNACNDYLEYISSLNESAFTDRKIEDIIDRCKILEKYHNKRFDEKISKNKDLEYRLLNYWNDQDDLYVNYIVSDVDNDLKANVISYFNTSDVSGTYNLLTDEEVEERLLELIKQENANVFELPKVSELSPLLKDIYLYVCENDSNMCHIDDNDWEELCEENNYTNDDIEELKEEIKKYNLSDYITIDSDGYKICGYGCLQCCFNDDTLERTDDFER